MMDNREIDKLIAEKVMGWEVIDDYDIRDSSPNQWNMAREGFSPSNNITAAWQVEQKIDETPNLFNEYISALTDILQIPKNGQGFSKGELWAFLRATPLQRCLAALKAVGVDL